MPNETLQASGQFARSLAAQAASFLPNLLVAVLILAAGFVVANWLARLVIGAFRHSTHVDPTVLGPLGAIVRYVVIILALLVALGQVGVQMTSLLAVLGAAGLAIGLALQGTLTNIAAGIMLLWLRPFRIGDFVEAQNISGTVREIGLFVCHLETFDGVFVFVPNSGLWNVWLRNHSRSGSRLVAFAVSLPRAVDFDAAKDLLVETLRPPEEAPGLKEVEAYLDQLSGDAQVVVVRTHVDPNQVAEAQHTMPEMIRTALSRRFGADGEPKTIQRLVPADSDPSRYLAG
ncbi:mechanosensitive ion channel family protein [Aureimonas leprariae]|uniref:Small-conductance mechanosensitive channel n=1 Tax=Plantimonas leprariae TaxID=2615207 RepID=A0A7V7PTE7_9HYPH|nr:mechanosensitive ion channel family protein [Aureimonas leprariae]KAB0682814.1 mechanosensitive ion channel family protein [Aureimonas leprariae]